jgi:hypothetical protein
VNKKDFEQAIEIDKRITKLKDFENLLLKKEHDLPFLVGAGEVIYTVRKEINTEVILAIDKRIKKLESEMEEL